MNPAGPRRASYAILTCLSLCAAAGCGGGQPGAGPGSSPSSDSGADSASDAPDDAATILEAGVGADAVAEGSEPPSSDASGGVDAARDSGFPEATHASLTVPNNGGPVLAHPTLVTITFAGDPARTFAEKLGAYLVSSPWLGKVGPEYGVGLGTHVAVELPQTAPSTIDDTNIQALIASLIESGAAPAPAGGPLVPVSGGSPFDGVDGGSPADAGPGPAADGADAGDAGLTATLLPAVYMVYVPQGTTETVGGSGLCDVSGGGYHFQAQGSFNGLTFAYAVVAQCPQASQADLVGAVSHELIEACTDPSYTAPAWSITDQTSVWSFFGGEVGDLCSFVAPQWAEGGYTSVQRVYSNASAAAGGDPCLPATGPYYAADVEPQTLVPVAAGMSTTFTIGGWSTAPVPDWALSVTPYISQPTAFQPVTTLGATTLNNGQSATLKVTVPAGTASQSYALLLVGSAQSQTSYEYALVGVYVP